MNRLKEKLCILLLPFFLTSCNNYSTKNKLINTISEINLSRSNQLSSIEGINFVFNKDLSSSENIFSESEMQTFLDYNSNYSPGNYVLNYTTTFLPNKIITKEQAIDDIDYLFRLLKYCYAPYEYFGGDTIFSQSKEKILSSLKEDTIEAQDLSDILVKNLEFLYDSHLTFSGNYMSILQSTKLESTFISDTKYLKDNMGYYKKTDSDDNSEKSYLSNIDGDNDIHKYMKLTISSDGSLSYVISKLHNFEKSRILVDVMYSTDKSILKKEILSCSFHPLPIAEKGFEYSLKSNIPYLKLSKLFNSSDNDTSMDEFIQSAKEIQNTPVAILDLRSNIGGLDQPALKWIESYLGSPSNVSGRIFRKASPFMRALSTKYPENDMFQNEVHGLNNLSSNKNRYLFVLVDKLTASAAELFIEDLMGIENIIIVGSNTFGKLRSLDIFPYKLKNSGIDVTISSNLYFPCLNNYEDFKGITPDIIVNDKSIVDTTINMIKKYNLN